MSQIAVSRLIQITPENGGRYLRQFFHAHGNSDGDVIRLPIAIGIGGMTIQRHAIMNIQHRKGGSMTDLRYAVFSTIEDDERFPAFTGQLVCSPTADHQAMILLLRGSYAPPMGIAGLVLDAIVGKSIAAQSARELLWRIADELETLEAREKSPVIDSEDILLAIAP